MRTINADELLEWLEQEKTDNRNNPFRSLGAFLKIIDFINHINQQLEQQEKEGGTHR